MKVSNTVSTLACLALLSTYSVNGFAKTGNGDSYSGPTLSGSAVALTLDKPVLNTQLGSVIKACLTNGGEKSYLSQVLSPFSISKKSIKSFKKEKDSYVYVQNTEKGEFKLVDREYFSLKDLPSSNTITDFSKNDLAMIFSYNDEPTVYSYKKLFKKVDIEISPKISVIVTLSKEGILRMRSTFSGLETTPNNLSWNDDKKYYQLRKEIEDKYEQDRVLMVKDLPIFEAKTSPIDIFNEVNGEFLNSDLLLKDLKMVYDRNEKAPYSPVLNINSNFKVGTTQFMAPNAEFADCVSDQLGRL
jgi:hypothetical protein